MSGYLAPCVIAIVGAGLAALGVLVWLQASEYRRVRRRSRPDVDYSLDQYQPMARLVAGQDADFLIRHANCPQVSARWERSRRRIVRLYLRELAADFHRLHAKARILVAESPEQYAGLIPLLFGQQFTFWRTLVMIELRLALGGWNLPQTKVQELVRAVDALHREISRAAAVSAA